MNVLSVGLAQGGILGDNFSDPTNERLIWLSAAGLLVVGAGLLVVTVLWWRRGRQEHPSLAPLEVMSTRSWWKAPEGDRQRKLDHARPSKGSADAAPPPPELPRPEPVDLEALVRSVPQAFDDLREPVEAIAVDSNGVAVAPAQLVAAAEPVDGAATPEPEPEAEPEAEPDATAIAAERPLAPPPVEAPVVGKPIVLPAPEAAPTSTP